MYSRPCSRFRISQAHLLCRVPCLFRISREEEALGSMDYRNHITRPRELILSPLYHQQLVPRLCFAFSYEFGTHARSSWSILVFPHCYDLVKQDHRRLLNQRFWPQIARRIFPLFQRCSTHGDDWWCWGTRLSGDVLAFIVNLKTFPKFLCNVEGQPVTCSGYRNDHRSTGGPNPVARSDLDDVDQSGYRAESRPRHFFENEKIHLRRRSGVRRRRQAPAYDQLQKMVTDDDRKKPGSDSTIKENQQSNRQSDRLTGPAFDQFWDCPHWIA